MLCLDHVLWYSHRHWTFTQLVNRLCDILRLTFDILVKPIIEQNFWQFIFMVMFSYSSLQQYIFRFYRFLHTIFKMFFFDTNPVSRLQVSLVWQYLCKCEVYIQLKRRQINTLHWTQCSALQTKPDTHKYIFIIFFNLKYKNQFQPNGKVSTPLEKRLVYFMCYLSQIIIIMMMHKIK